MLSTITTLQAMIMCVRSHIDWREERVPTRTLGLEGELIVRSHISWRGERNILYKGVETSPYQTHFKNLEGNPKGKTLRGQYLLAMALSCYKWYQSQILGGVPMRTLRPERGGH